MQVQAYDLDNNIQAANLFFCSEDAVKRQESGDTFNTEVDGDTQDIWPKTAAWFLGPKVKYFLDQLHGLIMNIKG